MSNNTESEMLLNGRYSHRDLGDGKEVRVKHCEKCGVAPSNVDDCGHFGDEWCPYFGRLGTMKAPDWSDERVVKFRDLEHGERIEKGDWVDMAPNGYKDWPQWKLVTKSGGTAPDPAYPAHRIYRRILWHNSRITQSHEIPKENN
jgi:hypothetical protein